MSREPAADATFIREVTIRYGGSKLRAAAPLSRPEDAARFARKIVKDHAREHLVALYLDSRNHPIAYSVVSVGTATQSLVHPREVFQPAILSGAAALLLLHNHPSGDPSPSRDDYAVTERIANAGKLLGIRLLDHIVFTRDGDYRAIARVRSELFE